MTYRIHFTVNGCEDSFIVSGGTVEEIQEKCDAYFEPRGIDVEEADPWSEEIEDKGEV